MEEDTVPAQLSGNLQPDGDSNDIMGELLPLSDKHIIGEETAPALLSDNLQPDMHFDDVIDKLRPFGPYQWKVWIIASMFEIPCSAGMLFFVFGAGNPGWSCYVFRGGNTTGQGILQLSNWTPTADDVCGSNITLCDRITYRDEFTSIVTEVIYNNSVHETVRSNRRNR